MSENAKGPEPDALQELRNIRDAKRFDGGCFDDDTAFADWAQSRARHTLTLIEGVEGSAADSPAEPRRIWPFVESPGEFTERLAAAYSEFGTLLAAVRCVLIEKPAVLLPVAIPAPEPLTALRKSVQALRCWANAGDAVNRKDVLELIDFALAQPAPPEGQGQWRDHVEQRLHSWRQRFVNRSGDQLALDDFMDKESLDDLLDFVLEPIQPEGQGNQTERSETAAQRPVGDERLRFERWAESQGFITDAMCSIREDLGDDYTSPSTANAWAAWLAATREQSSQQVALQVQGALTALPIESEYVTAREYWIACAIWIDENRSHLATSQEAPPSALREALDAAAIDLWNIAHQSTERAIKEYATASREAALRALVPAASSPSSVLGEEPPPLSSDRE